MDDSEETPLLSQTPRTQSRCKQHITSSTRTPLPWAQFSIVMLLQVSEPLTMQVISPFAPQLIRDIGVTNGNETQVGYYVGILHSLFFVTQAMTVLYWSRLSDKIGPKPVVLIGLFGLTLSMVSFGLSKTFWSLVLSRCICGALNGNVGVIKSMIAQLTDSTNIAQAYAYLPIAWSSGGSVGPIVGGLLSHPADQFPSIFGNSRFLKEYPYFLPCVVPAAYSALIWVVSLLYLENTHKSPMAMSKRSVFKFASHSRHQSQVPETPPIGESAKTSDENKPLPLTSLFTPRVLISAGNYAFFAMIEIAFRTIQPLFFSTPVALHGLGLHPSIIGQILSAYGILNGIFQMFFFARIHDAIGTRMTFLTGIWCAIASFVTFPLISEMARWGGMWWWGVWVGVGVQTMCLIGMSMSFGAVFMFIAAAAPNRASLGAVNGLSQMLVSLMRAVGPGVAASLFSLSIENDYLGGYLVYYVLLLVCGAALYIGSLLPRRLWTR